jgi:hypothetical protein
MGVVAALFTQLLFSNQRAFPDTALTLQTIVCKIQ